MPIYFNSTLSREPFQFDSLGIRWEQEPNRRPKGFPLYHYLQTEKGVGSVTVGKETYFLEEGRGILLAPGVPHEYHGEGGGWTTLFATFSGLLQDSIPTLLRNAQVLLAEGEKGHAIRNIVQKAAKCFEETPVNLYQASLYSYQLLLLLSDRRVQVIANEVGYSDTSHFIQMFRKTAGMTPGTFRRIHL